MKSGIINVDQKIWVKEPESNMWRERHFANWPEDSSDYAAVYCWAGLDATSATAADETDIYGWPIYSITDPYTILHETWYQ